MYLFIWSILFLHLLNIVSSFVSALGFARYIFGACIIFLPAIFLSCYIMLSYSAVIIMQWLEENICTCRIQDYSHDASIRYFLLKKYC